jgi:flagellar motor switch protein FliG
MKTRSFKSRKPCRHSAKSALNVIERLFIEFAESMSSTNSLVGTFDSAPNAFWPSQSSARTRSATSWRRSAAPPGAPCGKNSATSTKTFWQTTCKRNIRRPLPSSCRKSRRITRRASSPCCRKASRWKSFTACCAWNPIQKDVLDDVERTCASNSWRTSPARTRRDSHELMAEIFNSLERSVEGEIHDALERARRKPPKKSAA